MDSRDTFQENFKYVNILVALMITVQIFILWDQLIILKLNLNIVGHGISCAKDYVLADGNNKSSLSISIPTKTNNLSLGQIYFTFFFFFFFFEIELPRGYIVKAVMLNHICHEFCSCLPVTVFYLFILHY